MLYLNVFIDISEISAFYNNATEMMNLLAEAGANFNSTDIVFERLKIQYSFINQLNSISSFMNSSILTGNERITLTQMLNIPLEGKLIYRATRDNFSASSFHSRCDGIPNTVTIIKTTSNSVFGGFTSASWSSPSSYGYRYDANAFVFSLRREGSQNKQRLNVTQPYAAIYNYYDSGPTFGDGHDIKVSGNSNQNYNSYSKLGGSYQLPNNITYGSEESKRYLAGSEYWQTTEIEVYQLIPFVPYSVSFLHNGCLFLNLFYKHYFNHNFKFK